MNAREGYSEQSLPKNINFGNVFCLPDQSLFICDVNHFFTWDAKERKTTEVKVVDFPLEVNSSSEIVKVTNSNNMFLFNHTTCDPDHNDLENVTSTLFQGSTKLREMPCKLYHPFLLPNNSIIGIDDDNELIECNPSSKAAKGLYKFSNKVTGFYGLRNNKFIVIDETNLLCLYELKNDTFIKIKEAASVKGIKAIEDVNNEYFACSILDTLGNDKNKIKDCKTKLQLWSKDSLTYVHELEIKGVRIKNLQQLPNSDAQVLIGGDGKSIFIIDFKKSKINIIDMGYHLANFNIADNGKLAIMVTDGRQTNLLIQIEPNLIQELLNQPGKGIVQTSINILKQPSTPSRVVIPEEKEVASSHQQASSPLAFFPNAGGTTSFPQDNPRTKAISSLGQLISETLTDEESFNQFLSTLPSRTLENLKTALLKKDLEEQRRMNMSPKVK
jgi:hypothetical protein